MKRIGPFLLTAALALTACGSGDGDVAVTDAWARASAPTQTAGAVYFQLTVADDDTLVGVSVLESIARTAEIHEVVMVDGASDMSGDMDTSTQDMDETDRDEMDMSEGSSDMSMDGSQDMTGGQMRMQELTDGLALAADETVSFEPGSYHVMLPDLAAPLTVGDEFDLTLEFANADDVTVTVEVAETAP